MPRTSRRHRLLRSLLDVAGLDAGVASEEVLGIGSAGLNSRGDRDEDGMHTRVSLDDGHRLILREYATTSRASNRFQTKEVAVYATLRQSGLPAPRVLASMLGEERVGGDPGGALLPDPGGEPLAHVFRSVPASARPGVWSAVGEMMRRLHDIDPAQAAYLRAPMYQRAWTRFLPYFAKSLRGVKAVRPDLAPAVDAMVRLRGRLQEYLDERPQAVCVTGAGGHLPGILLEADGGRWRGTCWLNLGYYVRIGDPDRDVVFVAVAHREWLGDELPDAFFDAYGRRPDSVAELLYTAAAQLGRGAAYARGARANRPGSAPPPHSTAVAALDQLPVVVEHLRRLLDAA